MREHPGKARVAVIGTGVSGLVAAHELYERGHDIAVFEADERIGGHSHTVMVDSPEGRVAVDTGFIVLNDRNYPSFEALLERLGVPTQPAPMSFSVSDGKGGYEWAMRPLGLFARGSHLVDREFHGMLADLVRFFRDARETIGEGPSAGSLRSFCEERGYGEQFVERLIVPQVSAVWSADPARLWSFPIAFLAEFLHNHGSLQLVGRPRWRSVVGGSRAYVDAIAAPWRDRIRMHSPVTRVERAGAGVEVTWNGGRESFDEVVIAAHSDQALRMLAEPTAAEREVLGAIPYKRNDTVLHTDTSLMPRRRRAWASWNYHLPPPGEHPAATTLTYDMNRLQRIRSSERYLVTLNRIEAIDPDRIIRRMSYSHPEYTPEGIAAQERWNEVSGADRVHFCGAYWGWGFHEDGVRSAQRAVERVGIPRLVPAGAGEAAAAA